MNQKKFPKKKFIIAGILAVACGVIGITAAATWNAYNGRVYKKCVFEAGVDIKAEDFLKDTSKEIFFVDGEDKIDNTVPGDYEVCLKSGMFQYRCVATIQDTIAPVVETKDVFVEAGGGITAPEQFIKNVDDITAVKAEFITEPDEFLVGKQQVDILVTDAGENTCKVSAFLVVRITEKELNLEAGQVFPDLSEFLLNETEEATFLTNVETIDTTKPGDYEIDILANDITYTTILHVVDTIAPVVEMKNLVAYNTDDIDCNGFIAMAEDVTSLTYEFTKAPNLSQLGEQQIEICITDEGGNFVKKEALLTVLEDTEPPVISGARDLLTWEREEINYYAGVSVSDNHDENIQLQADTSRINLNVEGTYPLVYYAKDVGGNETSVEVTLTVIADTEAPVISGAGDITVYLGQKISYKSGVTVSDNHDTNISFKVDNSKVNTQACGEYPILYYAKDSAGNQTTVEAVVKIIERVYTEEEAYQLASQVLAQITTPDMSQREILQAIYNWTRSSIAYTSTSDKTNWVKEAVIGLIDKKGDCFTNASVAKALLTSAGIENRDISRIPTSYKHYWNLVNIGEGWYHFDTTPRLDQKISFCYISDAELMNYSKSNYASHNYDRSIYTDIQ